MKQAHLLEIKELKTHFHTEKGQVTAVDGISFHIDSGEFIGIVGESGCGKSVTSQSVLRLFDEKRTVRYEGEVLYQGENLLQASNARMQAIRGNDISMIFQDPLSSLNPVFTIGDQIAETLLLHQKISRREARQKTLELLKLTGISAPEQRIDDYPHQLSGGMRQRIMIAIALACRPQLLIADEPTTALDVTIQAQILDLLTELNREFGMSVMLITHDLGVVAEMCSRVIVMYLGQIVEEAGVMELFTRPLHPYTISLIKSIPRLNGDRLEELHVVEGNVPSLHHIPAGCRFAGRCQYADERCRKEEPPYMRTDDNHAARCWYAGQFSGELLDSITAEDAAREVTHYAGD
ncbi:ABC transporter ATP-binding protein [Paenibacillus sp. FSL H7-0331]|uniref:ABC transporter ATP-binding protein n=1 Tax=Paenibacillus sp. FSL H7-0331 TaxID=1920421 RepID=UPI00096D5B6F|nr:ABC transporter ATP-binding protein [Paenibacillus sp. FSL H7-0331]OMF12781.1 peptide ABC transporter ATP-binding protein [Paenibacillus sp. FSL H7-0331]